MTAKYKTYIVSVIMAIATLGVAPAFGAQPFIRAQMGAEVLVGDTVMLNIEVVKDAAQKGGFPQFENMDSSGRLILCNDSVEIATPLLKDSIDIGSGRVQMHYSLPVQSFYPGLYDVPGLLYASGQDTIQSEAMMLNVTDLELEENAQIKDYADISGAPEGPWTDRLPDWLYYYWWIGLIIIFVAAALIWILPKFLKRTSEKIQQKNQLSPYELAVWQLQKLKDKRLWETGQEKQYYSDLTEILRVYLHNRFGVNAMEMTTSQLMEQLSSNPELQAHKAEIATLLQDADFVKFARQVRESNQNIAAFNEVARFVEQTRPEPEQTTQSSSEPTSATAVEATSSLKKEQRKEEAL